MLLGFVHCDCHRRVTANQVCTRPALPCSQYRQLPDEDVLARRRQRDAERQQGQRSSHCGSAETSGQWARHLDTGELLCHYCNAYRARKQGRLPSPERLHLREVERERRRQEEAEGGEPSCSHCGAVGQREWRRHSRTRKRLCIPCANFERKRGGELPAVDELEVWQLRQVEREEGLPPRQRQRRQQPERQEQHWRPEGGQQPRGRRRQRQMESSEDEEERQHPDALNGGQEQPPRRRRRQPADEQEQQQLRCSHCSSDEAGNGWRRHPTTRQRLCTWCFIHLQKQGGELPPADLIERQQREREQRRREAAVEEKRCTHCGSADGGLWRRERTTRALLCRRCGDWADSHAGIPPPAEVIMQRQQRQAVLQAHTAAVTTAGACGGGTQKPANASAYPARIRLCATDACRTRQRCSSACASASGGSRPGRQPAKSRMRLVSRSSSSRSSGRNRSMRSSPSNNTSRRGSSQRGRRDRRSPRGGLRERRGRRSPSSSKRGRRGRRSPCSDKRQRRGPRGSSHSSSKGSLAHTATMMRCSTCAAIRSPTSGSAAAADEVLTGRIRPRIQAAWQPALRVCFVALQPPSVLALLQKPPTHAMLTIHGLRVVALLHYPRASKLQVTCAAAGATWISNAAAAGWRAAALAEAAPAAAPRAGCGALLHALRNQRRWGCLAQAPGQPAASVPAVPLLAGGA